MPDYDPKSIPILDDIIEDDIASDDKAEPELSGSEFANLENQDGDDTTIDNLDLFTSDAIGAEQETMEPELGTIDRFIGSAEDDLTAIETDAIGSALIDYQVDQQIDQEEPCINVKYETQPPDDTPDSNDAFDDITIEDTAIDMAQPATLNSIVDDVVKQLLPDLEQQLHHLVQQALEEKLPGEIVKQLSADKND